MIADVRTWPDRVDGRAIGIVAFAIGTGGYAIAGVFERYTRVDLMAVGSLVTLAAALLVLIRPRLRSPMIVLALFWMAMLLGVLSAITTPSDPIIWVPASEALTLGICAIWLAHASRSWVSLDRAFIAATFAMLVLFGLVHVIKAPIIAGLIPDWMPERSHWPFGTGAMLLVAAALLLVPRVRPVAAVAVAIMFASWLLLVHAARITRAPGNGGEWQFAAMALALSGALVVLATIRRRGAVFT